MEARGFHIHYPWPWPVVRRLVWPGARPAGSRELYRHDAQACIARLNPPLQVLGREHIPAVGPCLLVVNHYYRPGFRAWWLTFALSAVVPAEIHWIITAALTFRDWPRRWAADPFVRWLLRRVAHLYGFTTMPAMPPRPGEEAARAQAVREVLGYVRGAERPVVGLAPEGGDMPGGVLHAPPVGAGRFVRLLAMAGLRIAPVGVYEGDEGLSLHFGPAFMLTPGCSGTAEERDRAAANEVMRAIAALLPARLRGEFGE